VKNEIKNVKIGKKKNTKHKNRSKKKLILLKEIYT
jgi:hypothetical protein